MDGNCFDAFLAGCTRFACQRRGTFLPTRGHFLGRLIQVQHWKSYRSLIRSRCSSRPGIVHKLSGETVPMHESPRFEVIPATSWRLRHFVADAMRRGDVGRPVTVEGIDEYAGPST